MSKITEEAEALFNERDKLDRRRHAIDNRLRTLRALYMAEERTWGIGEDKFRNQVRTTK